MAITTIKCGDRVCGYTETVLWRPTDLREPTKDGEYIVSYGNGEIRTLSYCQNAQFMIDEFLNLHNAAAASTYIVDEDGNDYISDLEKLKDFAQAVGVWYSFKTDEEVEVCDEVEERIYMIHIYTIHEPPKYWLDISLKGPVDENLSTYDVEYTDNSNNILSV